MIKDCVIDWIKYSMSNGDKFTRADVMLYVEKMNIKGLHLNCVDVIQSTLFAGSKKEPEVLVLIV